jgi:hypothetical protein
MPKHAGGANASARTVNATGAMPVAMTRYSP